MIQRKQAEAIFNDATLLLPDLPAKELADLKWFIKLTKQEYFNKGYFATRDTWRTLTFPSDELFEPKEDGDDIATMYRAFSWRGFLQYCQPDVENNVLKGFKYRGVSELSDDVLRFMLHYPKVDWINSLLSNTALTIEDKTRVILESSKMTREREVYCQCKNEQAKLFALLYLLDHLLYIGRTYTSEFENVVNAYTRSPQILQALVPKQYNELMQALNDGNAFDAPLSKRVLCVKLICNVVNAQNVEYTAELVEVDLYDRYLQLVPFSQLSAFCDGFTTRINDMPSKAASLVLELQKTGESIRHATLSASVYKMVYACTDMVKVNMRTKFICGLDIVDYSFKYWNLQASINAKRPYSAFSPFSLRGIQYLPLERLNHSVLTTNYDNIKTIFRDTVTENKQNKDILQQIAVACKIAPNRPALDTVLLDYLESTHPTDIYKIIVANIRLFNGIDTKLLTKSE